MDEHIMNAETAASEEMQEHKPSSADPREITAALSEVQDTADDSSGESPARADDKQTAADTLPADASDVPCEADGEILSEDEAKKSGKRWIIAGLVLFFPVWGFLLLTVIGSPLNGYGIAGEIYEMLLLAFMVTVFLLLPAALSLFNFFKLILPPFKKPKWQKAGILVELVTLAWGIFCTVLWAGISDIRWVNWDEAIYDIQQHSPVATWTMPTLAVLFTLSMIGYLVLRLADTERLPPLTGVLCVAAMYIGAALNIVWMLQVIAHEPMMCVLPVNILLIFASTLRTVIIRWRDTHAEAAEHASPVMCFFARIVSNAANWPWLAVIPVLPLLGIIIALLMLFGQAPDSIIQAWTQTADWTFSQQVAPPSVPYDGHYLCTVAAGGHRRLVKPIRTGKRRGHEVLVNRQLCVANAFEQLLEERVPRFHRFVRTAYDRIGLPVARLIKTPFAADVVWLMMKPLEWVFLGVLYLFDAKPENRIAVQYPHTPVPEIEKER